MGHELKFDRERLVIDDFRLPGLDGGGNVKKADHQTSERHAARAKQILDEMDIRTTKATKQTLQVLSRLDDIILPAPGEQIRIRTQAEVNMIALVLAVLRRHGRIDQMAIATYTLNVEAWDILRSMVRGGKVRSCYLLLASSYSFRHPEQYVGFKRDAVELALHHDFHLAFAWSHFKITLLKCGSDHYQIEGSLNYSRNNMAEQMLFENNAETYLHDYDFITRLMIDRGRKATEVIT
jgi:hypothetical protein